MSTKFTVSHNEHPEWTLDSADDYTYDIDARAWRFVNKGKGKAEGKTAKFVFLDKTKSKSAVEMFNDRIGDVLKFLDSGNASKSKEGAM